MNTEGSKVAGFPRREIPLRGYIIVLTGTVIWALTGIVIKVLLTRYGMEPLTIAFWRVFIVTAFVFFVFLVLDAKLLRIAPRDLGLFAVYGLIGVGIHQIVWISSIEYNGAAVATVIVYTAPAIVALFAWRWMGERLNRTQLLALTFTLAGILLVSRAYDAAEIRLNAIGLLAGAGSAFTFATYSLIGRAATRKYSPWTCLFYAFLFGTLFLLPVDLATRTLVPASLPLDGLGTLVFLALVPTLGGFGAYTIGLSHLPASVASILAAFEPVTTAIVAYFVFGEVLDPPQLMGAAMILLGVILLRPQSGDARASARANPQTLAG